MTNHELVRIARNSIDFRTGEIWYTAQVKGQAELAFSDKMTRAGWKAYTPTERVRSHRQRRGKSRTNEIYTVDYDRAMWPKYSFFAGPHDAIYAAKKTNLLQLILPDVNQRCLIDQLESLAAQLREEDRYDPGPNLVHGGWYRLICPHALAGYVGQLTIKKNGQLWIGLDLLGPNTPTFIEDAELLERV